jgi:TPR repeat protein
LTYHAFISHAHADKAKALKVNKALWEAGFDTYCSSVSGARPGSNLEQEIAKAIEKSATLVLLISRGAKESRFVREEIGVARALERPIIPVQIEDIDVEPGHTLFWPLIGIAKLDLGVNWRGGIQRLKDVIAETSDIPVGEGRKKTPSRRGSASPGPRTETAVDSGPAAPQPKIVTPPKPAPPPPPPPSQNYEQERKRFLADLERRTLSGDKMALFVMGRLLLDGQEIPQNDIRAARLIRLAADGDRGLPEAMHLLADCYRKGRGVGRNATEMRRYYERAARKGHAPSWYRLGEIHEAGMGVPRDSQRAFRRFETAAQLGFPPALFEIANRSLLGHGTPVNDANALTYAQRGAQALYGPALNLMGRLYRKGRGVPQSDAIACDWYRKAMEQGDATAAHNLATMYQRGLGVELDLEQAEALHRIHREWSERGDD